MFASLAADTPSTSVVHGEVTYHADERLMRFLDAYPDKEKVIPGYRVQIFLGGKTEAQRVRQAFMQRYPETPAYLSYMAPNFRVRVGDLRTRLDAERLRQSIRTEHPGCYVVLDAIEPPR